MSEVDEQKATIERILESPSRKKLVVAGPGTGKTTLFRQVLKASGGDPDRRLVLTFINNLKDDLEKELSGLAKVFTLHSYCLGLLHRNDTLRGHLSTNFLCCPGLASLVREDWKYIEHSDAPHFVREMRNLDEKNHSAFYIARGDYYDAVDFDDSVYRVYRCFALGRVSPDAHELILVDEYQDFNRLEAHFIDLLSQESPTVIVGDDDQALYSQLRDSSWDYIRHLHQSGDYDIFELPFCMRCPKVIVDAVSDVISQACKLRRLQSRIPKPFRYFPPVKGPDSALYPRIAVVETTVQRQAANYMGRYVAQAIARIPHNEIEVAASAGYPAVLVIASLPYRDQIISHLEKVGLIVDSGRESPHKLDRERGLAILKERPESNLGWRILLSTDAPTFGPEAILKTTDGKNRLIDAIQKNFRREILAEAATWKLPACPEENAEKSDKLTRQLRVKVTSFEGAKGLSAQHVFIAGLHDKEMPRNPGSIQDLEICKFIVGLTRTRKMCSLIYTRHFANKWMSPSTFISWIENSRLMHIKADAKYWKTGSKAIN